MCNRSTKAVSRIPKGVGGSQIGATPIPVRPLLQVGHGEDLYTKARCQVLQCRYILIHDFLGAQPSLIHSVLLEGPHKICKHSPDPHLNKEVVLGYMFGERPWNAAQEAVKTEICMLYGFSS